MNGTGLDAVDNKILEILSENARATFSEIGDQVGLSRVAVKNRIQAMEQARVIRGYKTIIDTKNATRGIQFVLDLEAVPEMYQKVVDTLTQDPYIRQVYSTTGRCALHAVGYAPNIHELDSHVKHLFGNTEGIAKLRWEFMMTTIKDIDGGVDYVRSQDS